MRIAVIAPPYPLEEMPSPPLGVTYVAAAFAAPERKLKFLIILFVPTLEKIWKNN